MTDATTTIDSASPGDDSRVKRKAATPVVNAIFIDTQPGIALDYVTIKLTENGITKTLFYGDAWVLRKSIARYLSRGFAVVDKSENVAVHEMIRGLRSASVVKPAQHELPSVYRPKVSLIWATPNGDQLVADMARVSVLDSEGKPPESLINYMVTHQHWSPLEMVSMCVEIEAPRDITRQILRHRSFSYQEKSARYSTYDAARESVLRECRLKHPTNRQMSVKTDDYAIKAQWDQLQGQVHEVCWDAYRDALRLGVAKEQARTLLPEGQVLSRMFMTGTVRSWVHYTQVRHDPNAVQGEHVLVAREVERILAEQFPIIYAATKGTKPAATTQPKQENPTDD